LAAVLSTIQEFVWPAAVLLFAAVVAVRGTQARVPCAPSHALRQPRGELMGAKANSRLANVQCTLFIASTQSLSCCKAVRATGARWLSLPPLS